MTTLFLVRHGLNDYVDKKRLAGWLPDVHLNEQGRAQAEALAQSFIQVKLQAVYSSPLERTLETAQPIARAHALEVVPLAGLGEVRYGRWQGRRLKSLSRLKYWSVIQNSPSLARFPGGESFPEAQARIVSELEAIRAKHGRKRSAVVCVSHADMIKLAIAHYLGLPLDLFQRLVIEPASISVLVIGKGGARLAGLNDTRAARTAKGE